MSDMDEGEILVGCWDCTSCGKKGVSGDAYRCDSCGAGRPDDVEFYLPSNAKVVKDAAGIAAAKAGADWMCEYCRQWVAAVEKECPNCAGGKIAGSKRQKTGEISAAEIAEMRRVAAAKIAAGYDVREGRRQLEESRAEALRPRETPRPEPTSTDMRVPDIRGVGSCLGIAALTLLLTVGLWALIRTTTTIATVTSHSWARVQHVEEYTALQQDGWDRPSDAYNVRVERRVHHHDRVLDHYETRYRTVRDRVADGTERVRTGTRTVSLGNGRFKREPTYTTRTKYRTVERRESYQEPIYRRDPVYRDYYFYTVDRWIPGTDRREQGVGLEARWPSTAVRDSRQRMASREESYSIVLTERSPEPGDQARTWTRNMSEAEWRSLRDGSSMLLTLRLGMIVEMQPANAEQEAR